MDYMIKYKMTHIRSQVYEISFVQWEDFLEWKRDMDYCLEWFSVNDTKPKFSPRTEQRIIRRARARNQSIEETIEQLVRDGLDAQTRSAQ